MAYVESLSSERRSWFIRLLELFTSRREGDMGYQVPADSLFANTWNGAESIADVPETIKAQIREEALLTAFNRLETSLRLLLYATTPGKEPPTPEHLHQILNVWRFELEHRVNLVPDTYCGAVQNYEPDMETAYTIDGRCNPGDRIRIRVPCWRMFEKIVIRGEAEVMDESLGVNRFSLEPTPDLEEDLRRASESSMAAPSQSPAAPPEAVEPASPVVNEASAFEPVAAVDPAVGAESSVVEPPAAAERAAAAEPVEEVATAAPRLDPSLAAAVTLLQGAYEPAAGSNGVKD